MTGSDYADTLTGDTGANSLVGGLGEAHGGGEGVGGGLVTADRDEIKNRQLHELIQLSRTRCDSLGHGEHIVEHGRRESAGERVLLAGVVAAE